MELRSGYKRTEVGVIPDSWDFKPLKDMAAISSGGTPSRIRADYWDGEVPWITTSQIDFSRIEAAEQFISKNGLQNSAAKLLPPGTLLLALYGQGKTRGKVGVLGIEAATNQACAAIEITRDVSADFLLQYLTRQYEAIRGMSNGGSQDNLNSGIVKNIFVPVPSATEQRSIATALSDVDALIAGLQRLIAKKRDIKQAAMQQLLTGQTRLPGFSGEWASVQLGDLLNVCHGKNQRAVEVPDGPYPILATGGQIGTARQSLHDRPSVLIGRKSTINKPQYMDTPFWTVDTLFYCDVRQPNSAKFLYYRFLLIDWMQYNEASGVPSLNGRTIERIEIACPDSTEQAAIATVLSDMDADLSALESRLAKTRAIKQGMMQELLTGRTRLVDSIEHAPAEKTEPSIERKANVYFMRSVLAAEIVDQLHQEPTFGHVKFEKMMFLAEHLCQVDTGSHYVRQAAGPLDRQALHSIDSQLRTQKWFDVRKENGRYRYVPLGNRGGHQRYFDQYFAPIRTQLSEILETFRSWETERCEIVATLYAAWNDLLREKGLVSDDLIVHEVLNNWHEAKQRIPEERWLKALGWMREKGYVPGPAAQPTAR